MPSYEDEKSNKSCHMIQEESKTVRKTIHDTVGVQQEFGSLLENDVQPSYQKTLNDMQAKLQTIKVGKLHCLSPLFYIYSPRTCSAYLECLYGK